MAVAFLSLMGQAGCERVSAPSRDSRSELSAANVPEDLRDLLPLAEKWGIGDDVDRTEALKRASDEELRALRGAVRTHGAAITHWLDSFGSGDMPAEAAAFMYMQLAVEELPP
jgi:hypothetical protein